MWLMVFFDLPVVALPARRLAARFRKFLLRDGYTMLQFSVYARICNGQESVEKHFQRLRAELPKKGNIRAMQITDLQYARIELLLGEKEPEDKAAPSNQLSFF